MPGTSAEESGPRPLSETGRFLLLFGLLAAWRALWLPGVFLELDSTLYIHAAEAWARHFGDGTWATAALVNENYPTVEYWPPLYPALAGLLARLTGDPEGAARLLSWLAGLFTVVPTWYLGRRLWGPREGLWAAALVGLSPPLAWLATGARSDALYVLLVASGAAAALAGALRGSFRAGLVGGLGFALAYMTRFEGLVLAAACVPAMALLGRREAPRALAGLAFGLALAGAPYAALLSSHAGHLTLVSAQKSLYDQMEAVWVTDRLNGPERGQDRFTRLYGTPGEKRLDLAHPPAWAERSAGWWAGHALAALPEVLRVAARSWSWALLAAGAWTLLRRRRDPRPWALLAFAPPALAVALLSFWDPAPRYYAYMTPFLALLAAPTLEELWAGRLALPPGVAAWGLPLVLAADLYLPSRTHFDVRCPLNPTLELPEHAGAWRWGALGVGLAVGAVLRRLGASERACAAAMVLAGLQVFGLLGFWPGTLEGTLVPILLFALVGTALVLQLTPAPRAFRVACLLWILLMAFNLVGMGVADKASVGYSVARRSR